MIVEHIQHEVNGKSFRNALVFDESGGADRPLLLMAPNWLGVTEEAIARTSRIVGNRYVGLVADVYGDGRCVSGPEEAAPLADALRTDAPERRRRICAALGALVSEAGRRRLGNPSRRAAVGFCFGGGNVLELARSGKSLDAAVCLHGDLTSRLPATPGSLRARLLILHGSRDPVAPKAERDAFEAEMDAVGASWQMLTFGGLVHSFSEEEAAVPGIAQYDAPAARQSYRLIQGFLADVFGESP